MPMQPRNRDEYWDGMRRRRLKRMIPLFIAIGVLAGGILLGAIMA